MPQEKIHLNDFLKNILNPPRNIREKQIWYSYDLNNEFLIINDESGEEIYDTVMLSPLCDVFDDGVDVALPKNKFPFLASKRIALRFTKGPLHKSQFSYYLGTIDDDTFNKVKLSLKNKTYAYDEDQLLILSDLLDELEYARLQAVNLFEKGTTAVIIKLPDYKKVEDASVYNPAMALAAKDEKANKLNYEFWEKVKKSTKTTIVGTDDFNISLTEIDSSLFLVLYSFKEMSIEDIAIKQNGVYIKAQPDHYKIEKDSRAAFLLDATEIKKGTAKLRLKIDSKELIEKKVIFE